MCPHLSVLGYHLAIDLCKSWACCHSLWCSYVHVIHQLYCFRRPWFFLMSSVPSISYTFFCCLFCGFPEPWGSPHPEQTAYLNTPCLGLNASRSFTLHIVWLWISVFLPICCRRKLLWWWLSKALTNEYSRM